MGSDVRGGQAAAKAVSVSRPERLRSPTSGSGSFVDLPTGPLGRRARRRGALARGKQWQGGGARTGPGREGPEARPPRRKVGAEERSPSAPLLGPSIVKERGGEAPRDEPGEPHSPGLLPFGGGFVSCKDLFAPHSLLFVSHSLLFEAHSLLFEAHSPGFAPSEGEKKCRDLHLERREGEGMSHSLAFAPSDRPFASHSPEIARLDELFAPSEEEGTRPERGGMRSARAFAPCTSGLARQNLRGMSREFWGAYHVEELL